MMALWKIPTLHFVTNYLWKELLKKNVLKMMMEYWIQWLDFTQMTRLLDLQPSFQMVEYAFHTTYEWIIRRVLLVCHKNKWRDLSQKLVTSLGFFYQRGTRKHPYWSKIFFGPMKRFSCPPSINKKQRSDKFLWQITSLIFVTD